jgi:uncharacterized membrane protein
MRGFSDPATRAEHRWAFALAFGVVFYAAAHSLPVPTLIYLPVQETWTWRAPDGAIAMHYYGVLLWGALGFAVGGALGAVPGVLRALSAGRVAISAVTLLAAALLYFIVRELTRWA